MLLKWCWRRRNQSVMLECWRRSSPHGLLGSETGSSPSATCGGCHVRRDCRRNTSGSSSATTSRRRWGDVCLLIVRGVVGDGRLSPKLRRLLVLLWLRLLLGLRKPGDRGREKIRCAHGPLDRPRSCRSLCARNPATRRGIRSRSRGRRGGGGGGSNSGGGSSSSDSSSSSGGGGGGSDSSR